MHNAYYINGKIDSIAFKVAGLCTVYGIVFNNIDNTNPQKLSNAFINIYSYGKVHK